jgi:hypothetical protein
MYSDPSKIRANVVKIRLNDQEDALINALVGYTGEQKASLLREMLLEQARIVLGVGMNFPSIGNGSEVHQIATVGH